MGVADRILLDVSNRRRLSADVSSAVLGVERGGSMESKPEITVTIHDPNGALMASDVLTRPAERAYGSPASSTLRPVDVLLDGVWYRLNSADREGDQVDLGFAHRGFVAMTEHDTPLSASRSSVTRAQFERRQVQEIGRRRGAAWKLGFWAYEISRRMPIEPVDKTELAKGADSTKSLSKVADAAQDAKGIKIGGRSLTQAQRRGAATAKAACDATDAPPKASIALFEALIVEPTGYTDPSTGSTSGPFDNPRGGDSSSIGPLQLLDSHLNGSASTSGGRRDFLLVCRLFLTEGFTGQSKAAGGAIGLARKHPGWTPGQVAQACQGSAFPDRYESHRKEAERALEAFGGVGLGGGDGGSYVKPYRFRRARGEDAWTNTGNLADEVGRRRFITLPTRGADLFVYGSDTDLLRLSPQATIELGAGYVLSAPSYSLDYGKTTRSMSVTVRGDAFDSDFAWGIPVVIPDADAASGKWLVWEAREVDGSEEVELELRQPVPPKPEPAPEVVQRSDGTAVTDGSATGKAYATAKRISGRNYPYVWGGGHAKAGRPDGGTGRDGGIGFDCSGYVCAILDAGGMLPDHRVMTSGDLASSWGEAGEGERMTVWANATHTFIQWHLGKGKAKWADTSRAAGGRSGPHLRTGDRTTSGFTARHWPGT